MRNPFEYGGVVSGEAFCNREQETADLVRAIENAQKLFVFSERRYGKTSLVRAALAKLPRKGYLCAYVDLWPTDSEAAFATTLAKAITESMSTSVNKLLETAKKFFGRLSPSVTVDDDGKPTLTFALAREAQVAQALEEALETPARIAARGGPRVAVVFDEFQQVLEYGSDLVERKLRSVIQHQRQVACLFLGSRKHLIQKMVLDRNRPLYRAGGHYPLGPIAEVHWQPFVRQRFADAGKGIAEGRIHEVCELTQGHPFYTQHLCHVLWELCEPKAQVNAEMLRAAVKLLLDRETYAYTALWESLTLSQKRFLKGLAAESAGVKVFAGEFVSRYGLGSPSNAQRAVQALLAKDIIDRDNGSFLITDRFFRLWIQSAQLA
ncbi:MAG TPA: ATP-binding protein [Candidatus Acidoferrum sp.]|nr:ATP-binding protein [Candidatus Acidoferrum sp.]